MISRSLSIGMARPQIADGGTVSNMEGSCEYIQYVVADSRKVGGAPACFLREVLKSPHLKTSIVVKHKQMRRTWIEP